MSKVNSEYKYSIEFFEYVKELNLMLEDRRELLRHVWLISPEFRDWAADIDHPKQKELMKFCDNLKRSKGLNS